MEEVLCQTLDGHLLIGSHSDGSVLAEYRAVSVADAHGLAFESFPAPHVPEFLATAGERDVLSIELTDGELLVDRNEERRSGIQVAIWRNDRWALMLSGLYSSLNDLLLLLGRLERRSRENGLLIRLERGRAWEKQPTGVVTVRRIGLLEVSRPDDPGRPMVPSWRGAPTAAASDLYQAQVSGLEATYFVLVNRRAVATIVPPSREHVVESLALIDNLDLRFEPGEDV